MRSLSSEEITALSARVCIPRSLVSIWPKDRETGEEVFFGAWTGGEDVSFSVYKGLDPLVTETRAFKGRGALLQVDPIVLGVGFDVRETHVTLNPLDEATENAFRGYDLRLARIEIHRALISTANRRALVWPARPRFVGTIDAAPVATPQEGGQATLTIACVSCARELTRKNSDVRSDESQQRRAPGDRFFQYANVTGQIAITWGGKKENPASANASAADVIKKALFSK